MKKINRWLLPDGINDVLPTQAQQIESLRRSLLDLYQSWGYQLVIPPLIEFTDSLLIGDNRDLDIQTFKVTDQLSGQTMGIRADMTPQTARIDAHSINSDSTTRLCYAGSVLHTRPTVALASRSPIQLGAECFGVQGLSADIEIISLMIESLNCVGIKQCTISLGHVEIFNTLAESAGLDEEQKITLHDMLQRKARVEIDTFLTDNIKQKDKRELFEQLIRLNGDETIPTQAKERLKGAPEKVLAAINDIESIANVIQQRYPEITIHFDLAELPGYHYHTGIVFAAYTEGCGSAIANGGRYDGLGESFGRARPATGFNTDLKMLIDFGQTGNASKKAILAINDGEAAHDSELWQAIQTLRQQGEIVITVDKNEARNNAAELNCDRKLIKTKNGYVVETINS